MEGDRRDEVLMALVYRARNDPELRRNVRAALDRVLAEEYRYDLTEAGLRACREFWRDTVDPSEQELDRRRRELADPVGSVEGI